MEKIRKWATGLPQMTVEECKEMEKVRGLWEGKSPQSRSLNQGRESPEKNPTVPRMKPTNAWERDLSLHSLKSESFFQVSLHLLSPSKAFTMLPPTPIPTQNLNLKSVSLLDEQNQKMWLKNFLVSQMGDAQQTTHNPPKSNRRRCAVGRK